jgi:predicted nucleic acid-binding protein
MHWTPSEKSVSDIVLTYLDASAIVKLVRRAPETRALFEFLKDWPERVTSIVSAVEVPRAVWRSSRSPRDLERTESVLARIGLVTLDVPIRERAAGLEPAQLKTLDAIHIATALELGPDVAHIVTYDQRQAVAISGVGLTAVSPGA